MLVLTTWVLLQARSSIDQAHAALTLLLVVLGGSASGGRMLGFALACEGFAAIDYFFQPPYDLLSVNKPLDALILLAFFATAAVTTELLARARQEADLARERTSEVASLSVLGAATLRYAQPAEALAAITTLVRETTGAASCSIIPVEHRAAGADATLPGDTLAAISAEERQVVDRVLSSGAPALLRADAVLETFVASEQAGAVVAAVAARVVALPLRAENRVLGVLVVRGDPVLGIDPPRRRFLFALAYYAALGVERLRLVEEASHTVALREANRAKDQVLASVSHDLRTPLTTIKVLAQGAEARGEPAASAIVEQADRLARMVGDLLELSRIRAGGLAPTRDLNTAEDILGAALRQAAGILAGRIVTAHVDFDAPALAGHFDFVLTLRIVGNLLDNALRYTPVGGVVDLFVTRQGEWLTFTVADRGPGVERAEEARIFDAFYRPAGTLPDAGHAGLGLSIAQMLAELQGGALTYAPREGGGSEFTLRLPAADADAGPQDSADME